MEARGRGRYWWPESQLGPGVDGGSMVGGGGGNGVARGCMVADAGLIVLTGHLIGILLNER